VDIIVNDFLAQVRDRIALILAVAVTTVWLIAMIGYVGTNGGTAGLNALPPADLAVLIAAGFAPLAGLWLVVGVFEQRRALGVFARRMAEMTAQTRQSLQQAESQVRTLMQLQAQSARTQTLETRRLALQDMAASAAVLAERLGVMKRDAATAAWARFGAGDVNAFVQTFLSLAAMHPDMTERMAEAVARDPVAATALATYVRRFERLAGSTADDKFAAEILDDGALGRAYRLFRKADDEAQRLLAHESGAAPASAPEERLAELSDRLDAAAPQG
jgi:hypothetical protein